MMMDVPLWLLAAVALAGPAELAQQRLGAGLAAADLQLDVVPHGGRAGADGYGPRGTTVVVRRLVDGLEVEGTGALWLRPDGSVLYERPLPHGQLPLAPGAHIAPEVAASLAKKAHAGVPGASRLTWQPVAGRLRKVWTVPLHHAPGVRFTLPVVRLDAVSGEVLSIEEGAEPVDATANIYAANPVTSPKAETVDFELPGPALADERLELRQCRDLQEVVSYEIGGTWWDYHVCTEVPALEAKDGDHRYEPVPYPADPARDEDDFAPPHLHWHVSRGLDWFTDHGWVPRDDWDPYLEVVANQRDTDELTVQTAGDPAEALYPYDNAYFTGGFYDYYDNWYGPRLVFGQGAEIDYAYDADVVYHELGHFIVRSRGGPKNSGANGYGLRVEGGALNEGLADYFSSAILGEGVLAEYAGGTEREYIRTLEGDATCATHIFGQVHYDSQPFAQGLWAFRQSLTPDDARALDEIVIDSLTAIGERTSFDTAYDVLTAAVDDRLGTAAGDDLRAEWDQRGVDACVPLQQVAVNTEEPARRFSQLPYFSEYSYASPVPGYLQFVIDVPEAGSTVTVRGSQLEFLGIDPYGVNVPNELLLLGGPGERIHWDDEVITTTQTYNGYKFTVDQIQWTHDVAELGTFAEVGTRPHSTQPDRYLVHDYALTFTVDDAGPFVFQFAHDHHGQAPVVYEVFVDLAPPPEAPDTGDTGDTPPTDTVPVTDTGDPSSSPTTPSGSGAASDDEEKGGCGCSGGASAPAGWLWLGALAAVLRRRRHGQAA